MTERKLIFVGGTAFSGSTFFDMTLGNDPAGFSTGEVNALIHPYRAHHIDPICGCGEINCNFWSQVRAAGKQNLYNKIFELKPEVRFIIDSSKDPFWINYQSKLLRKSGIETKHIVIWKTPLEYAHSLKKRGKGYDKWESSWINYFRLYTTKIADWRSVPYSDYTRDPAVLENICCYLGIPYFEGKEKFWHKKHHLLFGNESARVHLQDQSSAANFEERTNNNRTAVTQELRTIYYKQINDPQLEELVALRIKKSGYLQGIMKMLTLHDVRNDLISDEGPNIKMRAPEVQARWLKNSFARSLGYLRYARSSQIQPPHK
ncbi:MAG: hypothetical protein IPM20_14105 [Gammaproteobacteria bacterium]|nr:hypothetical protein [Gammaproteobacteria bacterium]